ncbi:MAG: GDSL-type esterase/lipase family protein [Deltaproteobacteria bacterium]|nr:GDSL-type esterase/lipase family protein [Deltaproteobacteria bacterium]
MRLTLLRVTSLSFLAFAILSASSLAARADESEISFNFTELVAFGDSLSDNGFADGYGFKRYCETQTWVEILAQKMGVPAEVRAWGGAMSDERNCNHPAGVAWSGLLWQIDDYLRELPADADISLVLFTVMVGSNDAWSDIEDGAVTAANIAKGLSRLAERGARHILYRETSALTLSPGYLDGNYQGYAEPWSALVNTANAATRAGLAEALKAVSPEVKLYYHESDSLTRKITDREEGFRFEIVDKPWWGTYEYPEPFKYLWYDEWHPTGTFHRLMAEDSLERLRGELND